MKLLRRELIVGGVVGGTLVSILLATQAGPCVCETRKWDVGFVTGRVGFGFHPNSDAHTFGEEPSDGDGHNWHLASNAFEVTT